MALQQCNLGDKVPVLVNATDLYGGAVSLTGYSCTLVVTNPSGFRKTYTMTVSSDGTSASVTVPTTPDLTPGVGDYALQFVASNANQSFSSINPMNLHVTVRN